MKNSNTFKLFLATALMSLLTVTSVLAQRHPGQGKGMPRYDPATEITVTGVIREVQQIGGATKPTGTHLILDTEAGAFDVRLGPSAFLAENSFTLAKGDRIEVTGSKVRYGDADALIARELKKDGKVLAMRDAKGRPAWSRRNR
ncbi:MAG TPA: hypothetical protein VG778_08795 [Blastocatellia bacterium]|jgi:DNA/RNA endonuclease YhcR with UshA esterase domain|nr:hypothetical protein [Blastocatellia bacterium]